MIRRLLQAINDLVTALATNGNVWYCAKCGGPTDITYDCLCPRCSALGAIEAAQEGAA